MVKRYIWRHPAGRVYVRKGGRLLGRIMAPEGTEAFDREYWAILSGRAAAARTSFSALITSYRRSARWAKLSPRTRADYEKVLLYIDDKLGTRDATRLIRRDVIAARDANTHRTRFANYVPSVLSVLMEHAIDLGWRRDNPAKGVPQLVTPEDRRRPHVPWTDAAVAKWRAEAAPLPRLIFELAVGTVQRPGDLPRFRWSDFDGDSLHIRQGKTGAELLLPVTDQLRRALAEAPRRGLTILGDEAGRPLSYAKLARVMRAERARLGLEAYDLHALRYRGVMELAWAGCPDDEIAAYSGHTSMAMIRKYAGKARQVMAARRAREKRR